MHKAKREEYIKAHKEIWPKALLAMKKSGIEREIIWMNGDQILIYAMAENFDDCMVELAKTSVAKKWWKKMKPLLKKMQDYSGKGSIVKLEKIFDLEEKLAEIK